MSRPLPDPLLAEIRAEMGRQGITQTVLAGRAGMTQPSLSKRLSGRSELTLGELYAISGALHVSAVDLMRRAEQVAA